MADGERPFSSGKLGLSVEDLEKKQQRIDVQLQGIENKLYPQRYMARLVLAEAWTATDPAFKEDLKRVDDLSWRNPTEWWRQREELKAAAVRRMNILDKIRAQQQAVDEWQEAQAHRADGDTEFSNGYTDFANSIRIPLAKKAFRAIGIAIGDYSREMKETEYLRYYKDSHTLMTPVLFSDIEQKAPYATEQFVDFGNVVLLTFRQQLYNHGDTLAKTIREENEKKLIVPHDKFVAATVEEGRDFVPTEEVEIPGHEKIAA